MTHPSEGREAAVCAHGKMAPPCGCFVFVQPAPTAPPPAAPPEVQDTKRALLANLRAIQSCAKDDDVFGALDDAARFAWEAEALFDKLCAPVAAAPGETAAYLQTRPLTDDELDTAARKLVDTLHAERRTDHAAALVAELRARYWRLASRAAAPSEARGETEDAVLAHARLKGWIRERVDGGCQVISLGHACRCPLCDADAVFDEVASLRSALATAEAEADRLRDDVRRFGRELAAYRQALATAYPALRRITLGQYDRVTEEQVRDLLDWCDRQGIAAPSTGTTPP